MDPESFIKIHKFPCNAKMFPTSLSSTLLVHMKKKHGANKADFEYSPVYIAMGRANNQNRNQLVWFLSLMDIWLMVDKADSFANYSGCSTEKQRVRQSGMAGEIGLILDCLRAVRGCIVNV